MSIEQSATFKKVPHQVSCSLNEEVAILNLNSSLYFGLDEVGAFVWNLLSEPRTIAQLSLAVTDHFEVNEGQCLADMRKFLTELTKAGLVEELASWPSST